jgi:hypothetical protein
MRTLADIGLCDHACACDWSVIGGDDAADQNGFRNHHEVLMHRAREDHSVRRRSVAVRFDANQFLRRVPDTLARREADRVTTCGVSVDTTQPIDRQMSLCDAAARRVGHRALHVQMTVAEHDDEVVGFHARISVRYGEFARGVRCGLRRYREPRRRLHAEIEAAVGRRRDFADGLHEVAADLQA